MCRISKQKHRQLQLCLRTDCSRWYRWKCGQPSWSSFLRLLCSALLRQGAFCRGTGGTRLSPSRSALRGSRRSPYSSPLDCLPYAIRRVSASTRSRVGLAPPRRPRLPENRQGRASVQPSLSQYPDTMRLLFSCGSIIPQLSAYVNMVSGILHKFSFVYNAVFAFLALTNHKGSLVYS